MNKAILVIDMPESCKDCSIRFTDEYSDYCPCKSTSNDVFDYVQENKKPSWCPLKPLPERRDSLTVSDWGFEGGFNSGYNTFLKELLNDNS